MAQPKPGAGPKDTMTMFAARRRVAIERGRQLKLKNDVTRGLLVDAKAVQREHFGAARVVRESVLNVPARIAAELAAETDPAKLLLRLEAELRLALAQAADHLATDG